MKKKRLNLFDALIEEPKSIIRSSYLYLKYRNLLKKNNDLKKYKSNRVFIIGNGPSVNDIDIKYLKDEDIIVMNKFYNHEYSSELFSGRGSKFYLSPPLHPPHDLNYWLDHTRKIKKCITSDSILLLGLSQYKNNFQFIDHFNGNDYKNKFYFLPSGSRFIEYGFLSKFFLNLKYPIISAGTASVYALLFALFINYDEIYLIGVDHSHILGKFGKLNNHFYDFKENHIELASNEMQLYLQSNTLFQYKYLASCYSNPKIFNCSKLSIVDFFPSRDFRSLF